MTLADNPNRRATPVQARSAATLEAIIEAAARLLREQGLPGFNTNAVARLAGINVATLYHYFPHKNAILKEMFDRNERERIRVAGPQVARLAVMDDVEAWVREMAALLVSIRRNQTAGVVLRRACRAVPELMQADDEANTAMAEHLARALRSRFPGLPPARSVIVARTMIEVTAGLLDAVGANPQNAEAIVVELECMMRGYLKELQKTISQPMKAKGPSGSGSISSTMLPSGSRP